MASFPTLADGKVTRYPATCATEYLTGVHVFADGTEQRWKKRAPLVKWTLNINEVKAADVETAWTFFNTCKGAFDKTWDITISSVLYSYCSFDTDDFNVTESRPGRFSLSLPIRQVRK